MKTSSNLKSFLLSIDHKGYPAYKSLKGSYQFPGYIFTIDHVQGDPFASPSRVSIDIPAHICRFPAKYYDTLYKKTALCDHLTRLLKKALDRYSFKAKGSGKSGLITISSCGQEILERTACCIHSQKGDLSVHFEIGFPANGRKINAKELSKIFFDFLPACVEQSLIYKNIDQKALKNAIDLSEDQHFIRTMLPKSGLIAFVADGSVLPRKSGISQLPLRSAVPFRSPENYRVSFDLPHHGTISGMGIPKGITLIVGGGYHGKSTLLKALEAGIYDHIANDGREYVITDPTAMKIRAEDGRSIQHTDISMFINHLPNGKNTVSFSTEDASGSTSQAANVVEAMEAGTEVLLIDEDTSATNFMVRDELMQRVVHPDSEPITPFIDRVRGLYENQGISSIIVAGSSGAYFHIADHILQMDQYVPKDITDFAKEQAADFPTNFAASAYSEPAFDRKFLCTASLKKERRLKLKTMGKDSFSLNRDVIELRYIEQIADSEQTTALSYCLLYLEMHIFNGKHTLRQAVDELFTVIEKDGLAAITDSSYVKSGLAMPRRQEVFACVNRYRNLNIEK
ncbi:MAG: ABC-ATPase domain-containing protein [Lachnospiraceae bacterium]|nr:ABC-ATPase domain-containing protein [Lachnospiraceae bacterium]